MTYDTFTVQPSFIPEARYGIYKSKKIICTKKILIWARFTFVWSLYLPLKKLNTENVAIPSIRSLKITDFMNLTKTFISQRKYFYRPWKVYTTWDFKKLRNNTRVLYTSHIILNTYNVFYLQDFHNFLQLHLLSALRCVFVVSLRFSASETKRKMEYTCGRPHSEMDEDSFTQDKS